MCNTGGDPGIAHQVPRALKPLQSPWAHDPGGRASEMMRRNTREEWDQTQHDTTRASAGEGSSLSQTLPSRYSCWWGTPLPPSRRYFPSKNFPANPCRSAGFQRVNPWLPSVDEPGPLDAQHLQHLLGCRESRRGGHLLELLQQLPFLEGHAHNVRVDWAAKRS